MPWPDTTPCGKLAQAVEAGGDAADIRNGSSKPIKKLGLLGLVKKKLAAKGIKGLGALMPR